MKSHFSKFLRDRERLHFAAHSHHPWPDVTFEAHQQAWLDAAERVDDKWEHVFGTVWPEAAKQVAKELALPSPESIVFATNTHELVLRLLSCLPEKARIVSTDSEFHSFERQTRRLEEAGKVTVERVAALPLGDLVSRLLDACVEVRPHLVFVSQVFFNSGAMVTSDELHALIASMPSGVLVVIDGYHGFCAVPTDWSMLGDRAFYLAGGYKYAMAGEGACFLHVPRLYQGVRPVDTGWFAAFEALEEPGSDEVPYAIGGASFLGATFDPSGLYRLNAALRWRERQGVTAATTRAHALGLQRRFVAGLKGSRVRAEDLMVGIDDERRGQFLTFRTSEARALTQALKAKRVDTDARDDRLRFGFGVYQDEADVDALLERVNSL